MYAAALPKIPWRIVVLQFVCRVLSKCYCILQKVDVEYSNNLLGKKQKEVGRICSQIVVNGASGDVVEIKTANDLRNMSKSAHYVLVNDIDLSGAEWNNPSNFSGKFDGQGHTIFGMNFVGTVENKDFEWGLFNRADGIICNLNLQGRLISTITSTTDTKYNAYAGGLCGYTSSHINVYNVKNNVDLTVIDGGALSLSYVGGLFGECTETVKIDNCINNGSISGMNCGDLVGCVNGVIDIENCVNHGSVSGLNGCGGIVGSTSTVGQIMNCSNYGKVITKKDFAGGIAGYTNVPIYQCLNDGEISGRENVGGITGTFGGSGEIVGCFNYGNVTAEGTCAGGIAGQTCVLISQSYNYGDIRGLERVGGIVGYDIGHYIDNCGNSGTIHSAGGNISGIVGHAESGITITNCFNSGEIDGNYSAGGIIGNGSNGVLINNCYNSGSIVLSQLIGFIAGCDYCKGDNNYFTGDYDDSLFSPFGTQKSLPEIIEIMRELWDNEIWDFDNLDQYGNPTLRGLPSTNE